MQTQQPAASADAGTITSLRGQYRRVWTHPSAAAPAQPIGGLTSYSDGALSSDHVTAMYNPQGSHPAKWLIWLNAPREVREVFGVVLPLVRAVIDDFGNLVAVPA